MLQTQWQTKFQRNDNGDWSYVEYIPAWTDPDWDQRFIYIHQAATEGGDVRTANYAKPGLLQTLRPALLPSDAQYNPTAEAKRWGFYPHRTQYDDTDIRYVAEVPEGASGTTPTEPRFLDVPLLEPQVTARGQGVQDSVTIEDWDAERAAFDKVCVDRGIEPTEKAFLDALMAAWQGPSSPAQNSRALALLTLWNLRERKEEMDEHQRMLFQGYTSQEVREPAFLD